MHSSLIRLQNVFGFFTTVAFTVGAVIALSAVVSPQTPSAKLELRNVQVVKGRPHYYSSKKEEYAHIKFDLDADLSSLFSWNTKQVFVYITASFPSTSKTSPKPTKNQALPYSEAIIWDAVIPSSVQSWHPNTYIHPGTTKNSAKARSQKAGSKSKNQKTAHEAKPYPKGTTEGILKLSNQKPKYQITTPSSKIAGLDNCTLHLRYNIQPWVGALVWSPWPAEAVEGSSRWYTPLWKGVVGGRTEPFRFPELKQKVVEGKQKDEELGTEKGGEAHRLMAGYEH